MPPRPVIISTHQCQSDGPQKQMKAAKRKMGVIKTTPAKKKATKRTMTRTIIVSKSTPRTTPLLPLSQALIVCLFVFCDIFSLRFFWYVILFFLYWFFLKLFSQVLLVCNNIFLVQFFFLKLLYLFFWYVILLFWYWFFLILFF